MIDLAKSIFLVDGLTEFQALKIKFRSSYELSLNLRKIGCNGKNVSPEGYANAAYPTLILALRDYYTSIVCILDREKRRQPAAKFAHQIRSTIINKLLTSTKYKEEELKEKIHVCVPDIMFENWIVSDIEGIKKKDTLIKQSANQQYYDGKSGATILKRIMKTSYNKGLHGPKLFYSTRFKISKDNSSSFKAFLNIIDS
jgi:hypothetical protein